MRDDLRTRAATTSMILGPALLVAGTAVTPKTPAEPGPYLAELAAHETRFAVGAVLFVVGHLLLAGGLIALLRATRGTVTLVAGAATAWGAAVFAGLGFTRLFEVAVSVTVGPQDGAAVLEHVNEMPAALVLILSGVAGMMLGGLVFVVSLSRAGLVPWWVVASFVAGQVGVMTGGDGTPLGLAGSVLLAITFGALALSVLGGRTLGASGIRARDDLTPVAP